MRRSRRAENKMRKERRRKKKGMRKKIGRNRRKISGKLRGFNGGTGGRERLNEQTPHREAA